MLATKSSIREKRNEEKVLEVVNISLRMKNFFLKNINFYVLKGEHFAIVGPTGSGKSLLLETIAGIRKPDSGKIILNGVDITDLPPEKRGIGIVYQDFVLFPHMSVYDNIAYGLKVKRCKNIDVRVKELAKMLEIEHLLDRMPETLSGGEKQRVAIARALAVNPEVILLDEPFSALDKETRITLRNRIIGLLKEKGVSVIHVTHIEEDAETADRIAKMRKGKLYI